MKSYEQSVQYALENWPDKLYRYRPMNEEFLRQTLLENTLYLSKPSRYNDPDDCKMVVDYPKTETGWLRILRQVAQKRNPSASKADIAAKAKEMYAAGAANEAMSKNLSELWENFGFLSLTLRNDHPLMWGHYAEGHKGVCLEFDMAQPDLLFIQALAVEYSLTLPVPRLDNVIGDTKHLLVAMSTKHEDWAYEQEWRIWLAEGAGIHTFEPRMLTGITLGCRMSSEHKDKILQMVVERDQPVTVYQSVLREREYGVDIIPLEGL